MDTDGGAADANNEAVDADAEAVDDDDEAQAVDADGGSVAGEADAEDADDDEPSEVGASEGGEADAEDAPRRSRRASPGADRWGACAAGGALRSDRIVAGRNAGASGRRVGGATSRYSCKKSSGAPCRWGPCW